MKGLNFKGNFDSGQKWKKEKYHKKVENIEINKTLRGKKIGRLYDNTTKLFLGKQLMKAYEGN